MRLYLISQNTNNNYDTYSDAVVCAKNEKEAQFIHPDGTLDWDGKHENYGTWTAASNVKVELIGTAKKGMKKSVICASFHAG